MPRVARRIERLLRAATDRVFDPVRPELRRLRRAYGDLVPEPVRPIRRLQLWDLPLLEHYLHHRARALGRPTAPYRHEWPPLEPKPGWEHYWEEVVQHLRPGQTVLEIGPGAGFFTDHYLELCDRAWLVDFSELLCFQLLPHRYGGNPKVGIVNATACRMPEVGDASVDLFFSLAAFVHIDTWAIYGYLREAKRVLRPGGMAVIHYASMIGDDAFQWWAAHCAPDFSSHPLRIQHPETMESLGRRVGLEPTLHVVEKDGFNSFLHLRQPST